jgi:hypothetical protein
MSIRIVGFSRGRCDVLGGQTHRRIDLLPRVFEYCLKETLLVCEVLNELRLTSARQPADGCCRGVLKPTVSKESLRRFPQTAPAGKDNKSLPSLHSDASVVLKRLCPVHLGLSVR